MIQTPIACLRICGGGRLRLNVARIAAVFAIALILQSSVSAYTLVLRSGRRIEIPANFIVTSSALTYEAAPSISVTVQISGIDINATERANNEAAGSLLRRALQKAAPPHDNSSASANIVPHRKLTDQDLETWRRARLKSEEQYERRRAQLGLPSTAESRRRREAEAARVHEQLQESDEQEAQSEAYWRARASALRNESAALDAEIDYLRSRLAALPDTLFVSPYALSAPVVSLLSYPYGNAFPSALAGATNINSISGSTQIYGRANSGSGRARYSIVLNPPYAGTGYPHRHNIIIAPTFYPYTSYQQSYDRSALVARIDELEGRRAGLRARWRLLEEEARRAGALPGWLRP